MGGHRTKMTAPGNRLPLADRLLVSAALLMVTLLAWAALVRPRPAMGEMEMAPGPLSFVVMWAVMMTAMMLPSELPAILLFTAVSSSRSRPGYLPVSSALFAAGYLGLWTLSGAGVLLLEQLAGPFLSAWHGQLAGATLLAAGVFQLTGLKSHCLRHCRTPLHFFIKTSLGDSPMNGGEEKRQGDSLAIVVQMY
jgi:predicted metal-binding membrane protein